MSSPQTTLFLDTETTGCGPKDVVVELAFRIDKLDGYYSYNTLVHPGAREIPPVVTALHGISTRVARDYGRQPEEVGLTLRAYLMQADLVVAHNFNFDKKMLEQTVGRLIWPRSLCTMKALTKHCGLKRMDGSDKHPTLREAYSWMFNTSATDYLRQLHTAVTDTLTVREIYYEGLERGLWP